MTQLALFTQARQTLLGINWHPVGRLVRLCFVMAGHLELSDCA